MKRRRATKKSLRCHPCGKRATHRVLWADGRAFVAVCASSKCHDEVTDHLYKNATIDPEIVGVQDLAEVAREAAERKKKVKRGTRAR